MVINSLRKFFVPEAVYLLYRLIYKVKLNRG